MALEPSEHVNGRMWPPGVFWQPEWQTCWQSHRIQPKLSERPSLGLGRAWSRRHGKDGDRSARRLLCNLRQTDRPRGQADDRADASRQFEFKRLGRPTRVAISDSVSSARCRRSAPRRGLSLRTGCLALIDAPASHWCEGDLGVPSHCHSGRTLSGSRRLRLSKVSRERRQIPGTFRD